MATESDVNNTEKSSKRRRKRREKNDIEDETGRLNTEENNDKTAIESATDIESNKEHRKHRRKRKQKQPEGQPEEADDRYFNNPIHQHVSQLEDDIISVSEQPTSSQNPEHSIWHTNVKPNGKCFVENHRGVFKAIDKHKLEKLELDELNKRSQSNSKVETISEAVSLGLWMHLNLQKVSKCSQGVFAGFAICQLIIVYHLGPPYFPLNDWLMHYSTLALPVEAAFYLLSVICLWTLLAGCNVGGEDGNLWEQVKQFHSALLAIVIYFITLALTLSVANVDARISLFYSSNSASIEQDYKEQIGQWRNVNLCRCIAAILAWLILCISPPQDYNKKFLENINDQLPQITNESA